jgi:hypothetical protein
MLLLVLLLDDLEMMMVTISLNVSRLLMREISVKSSLHVELCLKLFLTRIFGEILKHAFLIRGIKLLRSNDYIA